ncbi:MAG: hypothetical protein IJT53_02615 [Prevotella sp.]|nr:hypothetical protein [Prevotella sp.]
MKKIKFLAYAGAIALLSTGFNACSSEDDIVVADVNPTYNPETGEVTTDFVFNVATSNTPTTRMSAANTQATTSETFRGIDNAVLMSFVKKTAGSGDSYTLDDGEHIWSAITANKIYNMGTIMGAGTIAPGGDGTIPYSRRVIELSLPTESNALMFYGKAIKTGTDNQQGNIIWNVDKDLSKTSFTLNRRIPAGTGAGTEEAFKQYETLIAAVLTKIMQTTSNYQVTYGGENLTGTLKWSDYVTIEGTQIKVKEISPADQTSAMCALGEILGSAFVNFNTIYPNEVRAGSGPTVAKMLTDLYQIIHSVASATPTSKSEAITQAVASTLQSQITKVIDVSGSKWQGLSNVKDFAGLETTATNLVTEIMDNFPTNFHVPMGAATLQYNVENNVYSYRENLPTYAMSGEAGGSFNIFNYRYPAELCYFGNSPVRVTNDSHQTSDYPDGVTNWDSESSWTNWTKDGHVLSSTRSVAMQDNINYGTALLKTTVRYGTGTLYDNNANIQKNRKGTTEENATITVGAGTFTLTGILIGGVEETMGWNYVAKAATPTFNSFIYDSELPSQAIPNYTTEGTKSTANYTLVWDNWNPANIGKKQNVVYIALEFVNNSGKDFWGMNNLIRNGATFYISGKLDPDEGHDESNYSDGITWPTKYALPPYYASGDNIGKTIKERRIFMQDYMTEANFVIGQNSLQSAIVAVPDLRSAQISLGLSVDLSWSTGLSFEGVVLGQ